MKKTFIISFAIIISFLFLSQQLFAQRYYRDNPRVYNDPYDLNLTQKQLEKMDKLEIGLEKSLSPLFSKLRTNYLKLDELELQRNPDHTKIDKAWEEIYSLEEEIEKKEITHEENIRGLLTEDQRAVFDSYYGYGMGTGRGYYSRGQGGMGQGYYGRGGGYGAGYGSNYLGRGQGYYGRGGGYGAGYGSNYLGRGQGYYGSGRGAGTLGQQGYYSRGRGVGTLGQGYYGSGRGVGTLGQGYYGSGRGIARGTGRLTRGSYRYDPRVQYGRGQYGAGLGKWYPQGYGQRRWH
jgi:Spy/CpxP family protein refolding chaperone